jgi:hypothetical protein
MSKVRADNYSNRLGTGAPDFPDGLTGAAGTFTGNVSGATGTFTGNVSVGGVLTYADVTNVDSVGMVTARKGLQVLADGANITGIVTVGVTTIKSGEIEVVGVVTASTVKVGTAVSITDGAVSATTYHGDGGNLTNVGGVWVEIDKQTITASVGYGVTVSLGANLGVTTSYSQFKVYYDVWLAGDDYMRLRSGYGFSGNHPKDNIRSDSYYYDSGSWNRAGDGSLQLISGEANDFGKISAQNNKRHHWGELIFFNSAGRIPTNGTAGWPAMSYRCTGYSGGDTDSNNFNVAGHYDNGTQNALSCFQIYSGANIVAGEVRTYGLSV